MPRIFNDGQAVFPAKSVRRRLHIVIVLGSTMILDPVYKRNRIDYKVRMQVVFFVQMGRNNDLIFFAP